MTDGSTCIFCQIAAGRAEASRIYHDEFTTAFMDANPLVRGHSLVIPNRHVPDLAHLEDDLGGRMWATARRVAGAIRSSGLPCEGINLLLADGTAAGQTIFHAHIHVLPRYGSDGFGFRRPPGSGQHASLADREAVAVQIRERLGGQTQADAR